jgi:glycosyltransferase involved in cell wall biosynthesis
MTPGRILMTTDAVGGVWRYAADLCRSLNGAGVEVVLCCLGPAPSKEQRTEIAALGRTDLFALPLPLDWMEDDPEELDKVPPILAEIAENCAVDLLHLNLPSQACGLPTGKPVVAVAHSCVATWWQAMRGSALPEEWWDHYRRNQLGLSSAEMVVVPSRSYGRQLVDAYGPIERCQVVPNAVSAINPALADEPSSTHAPTPDRYVFAAARWWDESKNGALLDDAAVLSTLPILAAGACIGPGSESFDFSAVTALGPQLPREVRRLMAGAEAFVSPSLFEPFGLAAMEAAHCGTPLILADIPTYREIWEDAAIFVDGHDPQGAAHAINELAEDAGLRGTLGQAARQRAAGFTPKRQLEALLGVYRLASAAATGSKHVPPTHLSKLAG